MMTLYIDSTDNDTIRLALKGARGRIVAESGVDARWRQAEKLLPAIRGLLAANKLEPADIKKIEVNDSGPSFSSLRIGVVTANALAYALGIKAEGTSRSRSGKTAGGLSIVVPRYHRAPNITVKKKIKPG